MKEATCNSMNCIIYRQLADVRMSETERRRAEWAAHHAHSFVNALISVMERMTLLAATLRKRSVRCQGEVHS
jgi:hypothetical protein